MISVVTSGKGGAGKSTVSAGLGCALAHRGRRVLLIDGDAGLRSLDVMLGIAGTAVYDMADVLSSNCQLTHAIYPSPICPNVFILPAPVSLDQLAQPEAMAELCKELSAYYDEVIVDCPAGIGRGFRAAIAGVDRAFVVTTPDMVCARDAQIVSRLLRKQEIPARLIINRLRPEPILRGKMPDIDELIDTAGIQLFGVLPEDEEVAIANAYGKPLPVESNAAVCFTNIAGRYLGEDIPLANFKR
ncbi:MAG: septum site-determining protein MinD [Clostridia bacterium]|nr:septum site-determining protein MinD [Clostridia bacterium]